MAKLRAQAEQERRAWAWALQDIASKYSKDSREYRLFGSLAWGRFEGESRPDEHKEDVFFGLGYLEGFRHALLIASEVLGLPTEDALRRIHQHERMQKSGGAS